MRSALPLTMAYLLPVLLFVLSFWSSSSLDNGGGRKTVIARPFTAHDVQKLAESFELWPDPCGETRGDVDLYLVFSRNLEDAKKTNDVVQNILEAHTAPWRKCFREVTALSAGIHPEDDNYNPALQDTNVKWVNGPNRQFERTFRMLQQKEYEVMYLMESDSVPLKENWLSMLVQEMENLAPFSVMGSSYSGDKWDPFITLIPRSLRRHINGNAVYNLTDPILDRIVGQLEDEVNTTGNAIPYDYRIAQIALEAKEDESIAFTSFHGIPHPSRNTILDYIATSEEPLSSILKETALIGNYAATNMVRELFDQREVVEHGAKTFTNWKDADMGNLTLVVSDWSGAKPFSKLLMQLQDGQSMHPFHQVLMVLPHTSLFEGFGNGGTVPVDNIHRKPYQDSSRDLCVVLPHLKTEWYMMTDSHTRMRNKTTIMVTEDSRVVVSHLDSALANCFEYASCREEFEFSKLFADNDQVFRNDDTVFSVEHMKDFCDTIGEHNRPSATAYMAFLHSTGVVADLYELSDRAKYGSRLPFVNNPLSETFHHMNPGRRMLRSLAGGGGNQTECESFVDEEECLEEKKCKWNDRFGSCKRKVNKKKKEKCESLGREECLEERKCKWKTEKGSCKYAGNDKCEGFGEEDCNKAKRCKWNDKTLKCKRSKGY